ncbi:MAG: hypothetical protein NMNS01_17320 [Nitrosomonas sp.]|nr:MAG: hypothetical protein NMNS01_17320 [Nitrosomonas sp.]
MTDDEIIQYLDTIKPVYTDRFKNNLRKINEKWTDIESETKRLNLQKYVTPTSENVVHNKQPSDQTKIIPISNQLILCQEKMDKLKTEQQILHFMAQMKGYRHEWKKIKQMPRNQIDDIQKQAEVLNILNNKCLQLQEAIKLIPKAGASQSYSLSFGETSVLRGYWEDAIDAVSLTAENGTIFYPEGRKISDDISIDSTKSPPDSNNDALAEFHAMEKLSFKEVTFLIDPEKYMLRVSAREKRASISFAKLGLMKRNEIDLNRQGKTFFAMANGHFDSSEKGASRAIARLSESLRKTLEIDSAPFEKNNPQFKIEIPKDKRAKLEAGKRTITYDDTMATNELSEADEFFKNNDPDYDPDNPIYSAEF